MPLLVVNTQMAIPLKSNRRTRWKRKHSFTASKPVILIEKVERAVGRWKFPEERWDKLQTKKTMSRIQKKLLYSASVIHICIEHAVICVGNHLIWRNLKEKVFKTCSLYLLLLTARAIETSRMQKTKDGRRFKSCFLSWKYKNFNIGTFGSMLTLGRGKTMWAQ